jgi:glutamine amidotransferase
MIGIIDYGLGNINAFLNIYKRLHIPVKILQSPQDFLGVNKLILPGVGAFDHAMQKFSDSGMRDIVEGLVLEDKLPIIGICVGMQMLAISSEEGILPGLGWIKGEVKKFDESKIPFATRLPHMGWNDIYVNEKSDLFMSFPENPRFYFLHSYYFCCENADDIFATTEYGEKFTCVVKHDNIYGVQFHPEKSHKYGVQLLENFSKLLC